MTSQLLLASAMPLQCSRQVVINNHCENELQRTTITCIAGTLTLMGKTALGRSC
jgi:hypothetical protein